jgi:hypothetical protein
MKRTLFYDRKTGELMHAHYEVKVIEGSKEAEARLSAPSAAALPDELAELMTRGLDIERLGSLTTSVAPQSSRRMARSVDTKTGRLRAQRLELVDGTTHDEEQD